MDSLRSQLPPHQAMGELTLRSDFFAGTHVQAQVKRWRHAVGSPEINNFRGALSSTAKGGFVTTSHFTRAAIAEPRHELKPSIAPLDSERLANVVIRSRIATDDKETYPAAAQPRKV